MSVLTVHVQHEFSSKGVLRNVQFVLHNSMICMYRSALATVNICNDVHRIFIPTFWRSLSVVIFAIIAKWPCISLKGGVKI